MHVAGHPSSFPQGDNEHRYNSDGHRSCGPDTGHEHGHRYEDLPLHERPQERAARSDALSIKELNAVAVKMASARFPQVAIIHSPASQPVQRHPCSVGRVDRVHLAEPTESCVPRASLHHLHPRRTIRVRPVDVPLARTAHVAALRQLFVELLSLQCLLAPLSLHAQARRPAIATQTTAIAARRRTKLVRQSAPCRRSENCSAEPRLIEHFQCYGTVNITRDIEL